MRFSSKATYCGMGFWSNIFDRIEGKLNRPADESALNVGRRAGSESMIKGGPDFATPTDAARKVRRDRDRRRWRWHMWG